MNTVTRRRFLQASGAATAALAAGGALGWHEFADRTRTDPLPSGTGILVICTLYGGNDGLNTVIPAADDQYQSLRPDLAYAEEEVLPLGDGLGLNPGMPGLKRHWDARRLAIVRGVSYPKPDHSHFRSMDIWQTASPDRPTTTGWIGRWLDESGRDPLKAVSLEPVLPPLLVGARTAGASLPLSGLTLPSGALGTSFAAMGHPSSGESAEQARTAASIADLHRAARAFGPEVTPPSTTAPAPGSAAPAPGAAAPPGGVLARQLEVVARCVERAAPARVYSVSLGGFDTHADERDTQQVLLGQFDAAVTGFLDRMVATPRGRQVVLLVYSEFGRRVMANANQGTDHGTAGPVFVAGSRVQGGFLGEEPSLADLADGDVRPTTDFRDVYASVLEQALSVDPGAVVGARPGSRLPLLR